jgi:RNA polymerase sigma-70 factor (ECF subfamily)
MDEIEIITMLNDRDQGAIAAIASKYEAYCRHIAINILDNDEDVEECLNDTYMTV